MAGDRREIEATLREAKAEVESLTGLLEAKEKREAFLRRLVIRHEARIELEALVTIREGWLAENRQRELEGAALAYHGEAFENLAREMRGLLEELKRCGS